MPNVQQILNDEIRRLARKEVNAVAKVMKAQIVEMRKTIADQNRRIKVLEKLADVAAPAAAPAAPPELPIAEEGKAARVTPEDAGKNILFRGEGFVYTLSRFDGTIISSVVPPVTDAIRTAVGHLTGLDCMVVGPGMKTGMNVRIDDPGTLAGDLVVGSVAAIACYGCPVIILDLSTATTMAVVDEKACYRGGAIMPGVTLGLQALSAGTSLLPDISVARPRRVIATNTVDALRSGAVYATASMIDGMVERMEKELGCRCRVIATGGLAHTITPYCSREIVCDDNLLLKGLWVLYEKNRK